MRRELCLVVMLSACSAPGAEPETEQVTSAVTIDDSLWSRFGGVPGVDGQVRAMVTGPGGVVYVAGTFGAAGDTVSAVAMWNGTTWSTIASSVVGSVWDL